MSCDNEATRKLMNRGFSVAALLLIVTLAALAVERPVRIAFLDRGEVWIMPLGGAPQRQTSTGRRVEDFRYSPRGDYLAYSKRIKSDDSRPICSIVIVDVTSRKIIKEITPSDGWIDIDKWRATALLYHSAAAMEVNGIFEFDAARRVIRELDLGRGSYALDSDMTPDGTLLAYVDDVGLGPTFQDRLHLVNTLTGDDVVETSKRSVMSPAISNKKDAIAFIEVLGDGRDARDRLWIHRRGDRTTKMVNDAPVMPKSAGAGLSWSSDDRYVSINFGGRVTIVDVSESPPPRTFRGIDACWSDAGAMIVASTDGIDKVDVVTQRRERIVASGSRPQCLSAPL